jgi:hypothetical protein
VISVACKLLPYSTEQGINSRQQGSNYAISGPEQGIDPRSDEAHGPRPSPEPRPRIERCAFSFVVAGWRELYLSGNLWLSSRIHARWRARTRAASPSHRPQISAHQKAPRDDTRREDARRIASAGPRWRRTERTHKLRVRIRIPNGQACLPHDVVMSRAPTVQWLQPPFAARNMSHGDVQTCGRRRRKIYIRIHNVSSAFRRRVRWGEAHACHQ